MLDDIGKPTTSLVVDFLFVDFTDSMVVWNIFDFIF